MSMTTPPGWYPEPGHTGNGPALERWWDGAAWSDYTRTAPTQPADAAPGPLPSPGYPGYPAYPGPEAVAGGRRRSATVIGVIAALVLIAGVVAGVVMLGRSGDGDRTGPAKAAGSTTSPAPGTDGGATPPPSRGQDASLAIDGADGISLPVLPDWQGRSGRTGADVTTGEYPCPGNSGKSCARGGVFSVPATAAKLTSTTPEAAAKEDIPRNAAESYGVDIYGGVTSHKELLTQQVTVAGRQGYLVRWQIATKSGTQGYVQSLVFPSPADPKRLVLVRYGFDIGDKAPGLDVMDRITGAIKAARGFGGGTDV